MRQEERFKVYVDGETKEAVMTTNRRKTNIITMGVDKYTDTEYQVSEDDDQRGSNGTQNMPVKRHLYERCGMSADRNQMENY